MADEDEFVDGEKTNDEEEKDILDGDIGDDPEKDDLDEVLDPEGDEEEERGDAM